MEPFNPLVVIESEAQLAQYAEDAQTLAPEVTECQEAPAVVAEAPEPAIELPVVTPVETPRVHFTIIRNAKFIGNDRQPFGKIAWQGDNGVLQSRTEEMVYEGEYATFFVTTIEEFSVVITGGAYNGTHALVYGVNRKSYNGFIKTVDNHANNEYRRTNDNFPRLVGQPAPFHFDIDDQRDRGIAPCLTAEEADARAVRAASWLAPVRRFWVPSASSGILFPDGRRASSKWGWRCYLLIDDSSQAQRIGEEAMVGAFAAGDAVLWLNPTTLTCGRLLRTLFDESVWKDSQPDFGFGATLYGELKQLRPVTWFGHEPMLRAADVPDTGGMKAFRKGVACKALYEATETEYQAIRATKRGEYVAAAVGRGVSVEAAERQHDAASVGVELQDDWPIFFAPNDFVTVGAILADPASFHERLCCDPLDPEYNGWRTVAKIKVHHERVRISSFAHTGGEARWFDLRAWTVPELVHAAFKGQAGTAMGSSEIRLRSEPTAQPASPASDAARVWLAAALASPESVKADVAGAAANLALLPASERAAVYATQTARMRDDLKESVRDIEAAATKQRRNEPAGAKEIKVIASALAHSADEAERLLLEAGVEFYTQDGKLVRVSKQTLKDKKGREIDCPAIMTVTHPALLDMLARHIEWTRWQERNGVGEWVATGPCDRVASVMISRAGNWRWPTISGLMTTPTIRHDGSILSAPGYDAETGIYMVNPIPLPIDMSAAPTKADALAALCVLKPLLSEFPFVLQEGETTERCSALSVALSALMTPAVRACMSVVPMHVADAPTAGSGKSYVMDLAACIVLGTMCPVIAVGKTEEETEKRIVSMALAGNLLICIDNVNGVLRGDLLCQMITQDIVKPRVLGKSETPSIVNNSCMLATGNNIQLADDLIRRGLRCRMDANLETPWKRKFGKKPHQLILADRGKYVAACLTIVRAYILAGRPRVEGLELLTGFDDWDTSIRGALVWLGEADPVASMEEIRADDPTTQKLRLLTDGLVAAGAVSGENGLTVQGMTGFHISKFDGLLGEFKERGEVNTKRLGQWLARHKDRVINGRALRLHRSGGNGKWYAMQAPCKADDGFYHDKSIS